MRLFSLSLGLLFLSQVLWAQSGTMKGTVIDQQSEIPLIGAAVELLNVEAATGTVTDIDGSYSVQVPEGATELEFTYTGYAALRVTIGASNVLDKQRFQTYGGPRIGRLAYITLTYEPGRKKK